MGKQTTNEGKGGKYLRSSLRVEGQLRCCKRHESQRVENEKWNVNSSKMSIETSRCTLCGKPAEQNNIFRNSHVIRLRKIQFGCAADQFAVLLSRAAAKLDAMLREQSWAAKKIEHTACMDNSLR